MENNPSIEQIVPLLDEPGDKLIKAAHSVRNKQRLVEFAQSEVLRLQQEVEDSRRCSRSSSTGITTRQKLAML